MPSVNTLPSQVAFYYAICCGISRPDLTGSARSDTSSDAGLASLDWKCSNRSVSPTFHIFVTDTEWLGLSMLKAAGFVDSPSRGIWQITPKGRALLTEHPNGFDDDTGRRLMRESRVVDRTSPGAEPLGETSVDLQLAPDERIDAALQELSSAVAAELERILRMPPSFFEEPRVGLVARLRLWQSRRRSAACWRFRDGGIDGIISLIDFISRRSMSRRKRWQNAMVGRKFRHFSGRLRGDGRRRASLSRHQTYRRGSRL